jgi:amino acid adenylation domain-containing protein
LGILKSGAAYLPIDPAYPQERIDYMLKDSGAKFLITTDNLKEFPNFLTSQLPNFHLLPTTSLAYIIYTSGSTGRPKGVMVEHRNVIRLVKNTNYIHFEKDDRILQTGALEFDASTFEIWGVILNGLTLCVVKKEEILDPVRLKEVIRRIGIRIMWMTAPLFNQMLTEDIEIFAGLGTLLVGGDVLSPTHINQAKKRFPGIKIINGYGPTENTTFSTTFLIEKEYNERIPIGKPIANSTVYIVDKKENLQPIGIAGELWVGGDGVSRGYMNNPELTSERFITKTFGNNNPKPKTQNPKLYRTGDLASWLPDGNIEFLGRIDTQVKIRGFRVELGEIENTLQKHESVRTVVVQVNGNHLCAYIVAEKELSVSMLREYLSGKLPDYMIPSTFIQLEKIPLNANGKVDMRALPGPGIIKGGANIPPGTEVEKKLAEIWSEILEIERNIIGVNSNFFELGGHSLMATRVAARIYKEFNIKVPLTEVFKTPTIGNLAALIEILGSNGQSKTTKNEKREEISI